MKKTVSRKSRWTVPLIRLPPIRCMSYSFYIMPLHNKTVRHPLHVLYSIVTFSCLQWNFMPPISMTVLFWLWEVSRWDCLPLFQRLTASLCKLNGVCMPTRGLLAVVTAYCSVAYVLTADTLLHACQCLPNIQFQPLLPTNSFCSS